MPYGIELCTEDVCENEGKAVIKSCYFCGYGYGLHQVCIAGYGSSSTGKKYWIVHDSAFGKIRVERGLNAFGIEVSSMLNDEVRAFCALAGEHWPLAITRPLPPGKKWETFPARVKREEHQRIVQTSWSEGRLRNHWH